MHPHADAPVRMVHADHSDLGHIAGALRHESARHGDGPALHGSAGEPSSASESPQSPFGMTVLIGGSAIAWGDGSVSLGLLESRAEDRGFYSIAAGEAVFEASASSLDPGGAFASARAFIEVAGADFVFVSEAEGAMQGPTQAWARSEIDYLSIDIHGWSPPHGPVSIVLDQPCVAAEPFVAEAFGSFAQAVAMADSYGPGSLSDTFTESLAVENQFSFVQAMGLVGL